MIASGLLFALAVATTTPSAADACLSYAKPVELRGVLTRQTFPGPPNYESVGAGDQAETVWIVRLDHPVCVAGTSDVLEASVHSVKEIQLVIGSSATYHAHKADVGKRVCVSGSLFARHTGHHHTPVLLWDVKIGC